MNNDKADGYCHSLPGLNVLGRSVALFFFLDGSFSLPIVHVQRIKEENLSIRSLNLLQNAPSNLVIFSSSFFCAAVSNASWRIKFLENVGNIWIIYQADPLLQNMTKIFCFRWPTYDIFNYKPCMPCWITWANFKNQGSLSSTGVIPETKLVTPNFNFWGGISHTGKKR